MKFNLIVCTYKRKDSLDKLLESVIKQTLYPDEILIIDSSPDYDTSNLIKGRKYKNLKYYKVNDEHRGLTRQRNYGIKKTGKDIEVICFLDDDIILSSDYFEKIIAGYNSYPEALGIGGCISNDVEWTIQKKEPGNDEFLYDGWIRKLGSRNYLRKRLGLLSDQPPAIMPEFSHGLSISFLPPSKKIYPVEYFMGGVASYKRSVFELFTFSKHFDGYGLYEDMDFCLRVSRAGQLYLNTSATVVHDHAESGRPNKFVYGKMVVRNGWYVWRIKYPNPRFLAILKWYSISILLTLIRFLNIIDTKQRSGSFTEAMGRLFGLMTLIFNKPTYGK